MDAETKLAKFEPKGVLLMESLNALFEYATEGIIISDTNGKIIKANPSSERLFRYPPGELTGKVIEDLVPTRYRETHKHDRSDYYRNPRARSMGAHIDLRAKRSDGTEFPVEISLSYYKQREDTYVIAFIIDITERRKYEDNIVRLNQELEQKVEERTKVLQEALNELEKSRQQLSLALDTEKELNDMKSRFVTMASHEFRTPLSTILSSTALIGQYNQTDANPKVTKHVQRIKSAVTNLTLILNDFLSAEKLEDGKVVAKPEEADLQELSNQVMAEIQGILKEGQKIQYVHKGPSVAVFDSQILRNILLNLLSNAVKFSPENKPVKLTTAIGEDKLLVEVSDEGVGIPLDEQQHLFDRFFRARNVTNIQGTGLGLSIVSKYLEMTDGSIHFKSEPGKGTTFYVSVPLSAPSILEK
jgi:PAS domain S-box-containing protein